MKLFLAPLIMAATLTTTVSLGAQLRTANEACLADVHVIADAPGSTWATMYVVVAGSVYESHRLQRPNGWGNLPMETVAIAWGVDDGGPAGDENPSQAYFRSSYVDSLGIKQEIYTPVEGGQHAKAWKEHVEKLKQSIKDFPPAAKPGS
jgi:hypothetical protein